MIVLLLLLLHYLLDCSFTGLKEILQNKNIGSVLSRETNFHFKNVRTKYKSWSYQFKNHAF